MKKVTAWILTLVMLTFTVLLSGCGGASQPAQKPAPAAATAPAAAATAAKEPAPAPAPAPAAVEIRVAWWGDTKRHELYNKICDAFQAENKGITLVREPISWADYWDKLTVQSASGGAPDFMGMHPQFANDYVRRGVVEPLDKYVADKTIDLSNFPKGAIDSGIVDGKNYMIAMGITSQSMFVNKSGITGLGVAVPGFDWTWDDVKTIGIQMRKALDAAGKKGVWFIDDNITNYQLFRYWTRQNGRELYTADGNIGFTAEDAASWYTMWKDLRKSGVVPDAAKTTEYTNATLEQSLIVQNKTFVRCVPANQYKLYCLAMPKAELILIRNPSKAGGKVGEYTEGAHFAISAKTTPEKKLAAAKLINFWVNTESSMKLFGMDQGVPANTKMAEYIKPNLDEYQKYIMDYVGKIANIAGTTIYPPAGASEIDALFRTTGEQVMFDSKTPQAAAEELVKKAQSIADTNKAKK